MAVRGFVEHQTEPPPMQGIDAFLDRVRASAKPGSLTSDDLNAQVELSTDNLAEALDMTGRVTKAQVKKIADAANDGRPITIAKQLVQTESSRRAKRRKRCAQPRLKRVPPMPTPRSWYAKPSKLTQTDSERLIDLIGELVIAESMVCQSEEILAEHRHRCRVNWANSIKSPVNCKSSAPA